MIYCIISILLLVVGVLIGMFICDGGSLDMILDMLYYLYEWSKEKSKEEENMWHL